MTYYGIYKITNLLNGKMYIGQHTTSNIDDGYMGSGKIIRLAVNKYGADNFRKEWLMFCEDADELDYMERVYVDQTWVDRSDTYNLRLGGDGKIVSEQSRKKLSESLKGNQNHKGKHHSEETRKKMRETRKAKPVWNKGILMSDEQKKKISDSLKRRQVKRRENQWT